MFLRRINSKQKALIPYLVPVRQFVSIFIQYCMAVLINWSYSNVLRFFLLFVFNVFSINFALTVRKGRWNLYKMKDAMNITNQPVLYTRDSVVVLVIILFDEDRIRNTDIEFMSVPNSD